MVFGKIYFNVEGDYTIVFSKNWVKIFVSKEVFSQTQEAGYGGDCIAH